MKIKTSFTTNSSSSSFVIAVKNTATKDQIVQLFSDNDLKEFIQENLEYLDLEDYDVNQEDSLEINIAKFKNILAGRFLGEVRGGLQLNDWTVTSNEYGTECDSSDILGMYLYCGNNIDSDILKTKGFC